MGSTRAAPVLVTLTPTTQADPPGTVEVRSGVPGRLVVRPLRDCQAAFDCTSAFSINAVLAPAVAAIITPEETIIVHWHVVVTAGRFPSDSSGPPAEPDLLVQDSST